MSENQTSVKALLERQEKKRDLQYYWVTFGSMIIFTILAFLAVEFRKSIDSHLVAFFIVTLAVVQVAFQLFYFMHLKDKNHEMPTLFIFTGAFVVFVVVISFVTMIWIS